MKNFLTFVKEDEPVPLSNFYFILKDWKNKLKNEYWLDKFTVEAIFKLFEVLWQ